MKRSTTNNVFVDSWIIFWWTVDAISLHQLTAETPKGIEKLMVFKGSCNPGNLKSNFSWFTLWISDAFFSLYREPSQFDQKFCKKEEANLWKIFSIREPFLFILWFVLRIQMWSKLGAISIQTKTEQCKDWKPLSSPFGPTWADFSQNRTTDGGSWEGNRAWTNFLFGISCGLEAFWAWLANSRPRNNPIFDPETTEFSTLESANFRPQNPAR